MKKIKLEKNELIGQKMMGVQIYKNFKAYTFWIREEQTSNVSE